MSPNSNIDFESHDSGKKDFAKTYKTSCSVFYPFIFRRIAGYDNETCQNHETAHSQNETAEPQLQFYGTKDRTDSNNSFP